MDKLKLMQTFKVIVEEGSIIQAAKKLGITKAAASKHLIELESNLNASLLIRSTRTQKLTEVGSEYYHSLRKIFTAIAETENNIFKSQEKPSGTLRITSHRYFGQQYIAPYLEEFCELYPQLRIDLELAERFPNLEQEEIDILFGIGYEGYDSLVRKKIASAYPILCASPLYLQKFGLPKRIEDLKSHRYITHSIREQDKITYKNINIYLEPQTRLNDAQAMVQYAIKGLGIVKLHDYLVNEHIKNGELVEILAEFREPIKSIYVFYQKQNIIQPKIRCFLDFVYQKMNIENLEQVSL
jgi:DNA-binding transcriptional LysR family regulator